MHSRNVQTAIQLYARYAELFSHRMFLIVVEGMADEKTTKSHNLSDEIRRILTDVVTSMEHGDAYPSGERLRIGGARR